MPDTPIQDAERRFRVEVVYATVDSMASEIHDRTEGLREVAQMFGFLSPRRLQTLSDSQLKEDAWKVVERFPKYLSSTLPEELLQFRDIFFGRMDPCMDRGALGLLEFLAIEQLGDIFSGTEVLLRLFITLPIGIASAERAFSVLRRLKTHLRSTMTTRRTADLSLLAIEKDYIKHNQLEEHINAFVAAKSRRGFQL